MRFFDRINAIRKSKNVCCCLKGHSPSKFACGSVQKNRSIVSFGLRKESGKNKNSRQNERKRSHKRREKAENGHRLNISFLLVISFSFFSRISDLFCRFLISFRLFVYSLSLSFLQALIHSFVSNGRHFELVFYSYWATCFSLEHCKPLSKFVFVIIFTYSSGYVRCHHKQLSNNLFRDLLH